MDHNEMMAKPVVENKKLSKEEKKVKIEKDRERRDLQQILREHVDLIPNEMKEGDKKSKEDSYPTDGLTLHVSLDDNDDLHIKEHLTFMKEKGSALNMRSRTRMENHIAKHEMQKEEKKRLFGSHSNAVRRSIDDELAMDGD